MTLSDANKLLAKTYG